MQAEQYQVSGQIKALEASEGLQVANQLVVAHDGRVWAEPRSPHVPAELMEFDMQTQAGTCGDRYAPCPDSTTPAKVTMEVDWVRIYAYRPGRGT